MNKEKLMSVLRDKHDKYTNVMNEYEDGTPYWNYCRGKKDMIEEIFAYISENF